MTHRRKGRKEPGGSFAALRMTRGESAQDDAPAQGEEGTEWILRCAQDDEGGGLPTEETKGKRIGIEPTL